MIAIDYEVKILETMKDAIGRQLTLNSFSQDEFPERELLNAILLNYLENKNIAFIKAGGIPRRVILVIPNSGCILRLQELRNQSGTKAKMLTVSSKQLDISPFMERFRQDYRDYLEVGFIIMQFNNTKAHQVILKTIKETLKNNGLEGVRADDKQYSDDLLHNIRTYMHMHACSFGIAVFERLLRDDLNPNVALEVGYMMALEKPICLLKDRTLKSLPTDIVGRLYKNFDPQDTEDTLPQELEKWLIDNGILI